MKKHNLKKNRYLDTFTRRWLSDVCFHGKKPSVETKCRKYKDKYFI